MLQWLKNTWIGSSTVEFESAFDLAESIERLRAATKRSVFSAMAHEAAVGTVKETRVSLQRVIPMIGNGFKPFFVGRFEEAGGKVVLRGSFTMHWFPKLFMAVWFGILILVTIGILVGGIHSAKVWMGLPFVIGMIGAGLGLVRIGQWFSRRDPAWLSDVISAVLSAREVSRTTTEPVRSLTLGLPTHLLAFTILIALGGLLHLVSGVAGLETFRLRPSGTVIPYLEDGSMLRYLTVLFGGLMLAWAYGIYRRYRVAWWVGFGFIAYCGLDVIEAVARPQSAIQMPVTPPQPVMIAFTIMALLVLGIWGRWWYAQRVHFYN